MKKSDNRGFVLTETLVVSTIVVAALVFVFTQFRTVNRGYERTFRYNTVEGMYAVYNLKSYLKWDGLEVLKLLFQEPSYQYIDITACPNVYMMNSNYCKQLIRTLDIKQVVLTRNQMDEVRSFVADDDHFSEEMKLFVGNVSDVKSNGYRLWVEFQDRTFATLRVD